MNNENDKKKMDTRFSITLTLYLVSAAFMVTGSIATTMVYASHHSTSSNTGSPSTSTPSNSGSSSTPSNSGSSSSGSSSSGSGGSSVPSPSGSSSSGSGSGSGGSTAHCDRPGYPSCSSLGSEAGKNAAGTSCPPGHSKAFCSAYNAAAGSSANTQPGPSTQRANGAHCDASGYPSCYSLGYADGKNHPGTSCPGGHSQNYCNGYRAGAGSPNSKNNNATGSSSPQVDAAHCGQVGWPSCYNVGYQDGKAHPGTTCPPSHSAIFCSEWNAGAGNTTHCDQPRWPSCYSIGYAEGQHHPGATCPSGHTASFCSGWNAGSGNTTHCDQAGWPSCYDVGYLAGKNAPGTPCPPGHSKAFCNGYGTGANTSPLLDTHCDASGYPSCYSLGYQAGKNAPGTPCPSGHSLNYCSGWEVSSRLHANELLVTDAGYKTAQNTAIDIQLSAKDTNPTAKVTISVVSPPTHGNLKSTGPSNHYTYKPNSGFSGRDTFQYTASDDIGTKSNVGTISITVGSPPPPTPNGSLRILSHTSYIDSVGAFHVVGEVENNSSKTAKFVEIIGTFYNSNGTVVGTSFTFTKPHDLAPGAKAPFDLILISASVPTNQIKHYSLHLGSQ
ncbi:MAG: Ig-like domain-containing protein [Thermoproteota archaeon]|nr:Ig-like domain-containing protein [Thermoproteota archaeon]